MKQLTSTGMFGLLTFLFAAAAVAAPEGNNSVVHVQIEPDAVYFVPMEGLERGETTLTVSGPEDCYLERDFKERETGVFKIFDDEGKVVPDGQYKFTVVFRPILSRRDQNLLAAARKRNDPKEIKELRREGIIRATLADAGYFRVANGKFVFENEEERALGGNTVVSQLEPPVSTPVSVDTASSDGIVGVMLRDFVINDDLIVDGSACIGFDCVNGESFGFDTIRLKENNLRIKFEDTSTAASFPTTDWQLTANASANGGASKFSIDDISGSRTPFTVEANARSHSLYVDDGGRIGNRTSTPATEIHTIDGDTPTLRLQQDGSSGFAPQTWDVAGNETNFFVRDVSNGSTLPFRIRPGAPTSAILVDVDGEVGFGTTSPDADLHILDSAGNSELQLETASQGWKWRANSSNNQMNVIDDTFSKTPLRIAANSSTNMLGLGIDTAGADAPNTVSFGRDGSPEITVDIQGSVIVDGTVQHADYVFDPEFDLETIDEHAEFMWKNRHLPALPKAPVGLKGRVDLVSHQMGILGELEKAHIYIDQLNNELGELRGLVESLLEKEKAER